MNGLRRWSFYTSSSIGLATCFAPAVAAQIASGADATNSQAEATAEASLNGEIVVTAQKREQSVNKVPMSISAATASTLLQQGITSSADLGKIVPGFNYTRSGYGPPIYTIRGVGFYDTSLGSPPTVTTYVDQVPLPVPVLTLGTNLDLERVEVLKGPQGTLFGQNATGGAINYVAAKPTPDFHAGMDFSFGRFNTIDTQGFVSGPLSDTVRIRVAARLSRNDDWQYSYTRSASLGSSNLLVGRVLLEFAPTNATTLTVNVNGWRDRSDNQAARLLASLSPSAIRDFPLPPDNPRAADWTPGKSFTRHQDFVQAAANLKHDFGAVQLTAISSYLHFKRRSLTDADGTSFVVQDVATPGTVKAFSQEVRFEGSFGGSTRWTAGANYDWTHTDDSAAPSVRDAVQGRSFAQALVTNDQRAKTWAIFGNTEVEIMPSLTLTAGARYTNQHRSFEGGLYDTGVGDLARLISGLATRLRGAPVVIAPGSVVTLNGSFLPSLVNKQLNEDNLSWRVGANWNVDSRTLLYANVSKGYKSGAFPTLGGTFDLQYNPARQESLLAYEVGFKASLLDRRVQLNGALFHYDYTDKQIRGKTPDPVLGAQNAFVNIPKSRVNGAELQLTANLIDGLSLRTGASYVDTKIRGNFQSYNLIGALQQLGGQSFPLSPKWQLNGSADYDVITTDSFIGFIGATATYRSATNGGLGQLDLFRIPAYTLLDFQMGLRSPSDQWRATAFIRNATNKLYYTLSSAPSVEAAIAYAGMPQTYGISLSYRY